VKTLLKGGVGSNTEKPCLSAWVDTLRFRAAWRFDAVSRVLNSSCPVEPLGDFSSIFAGMSLPGCATPSEAYSVDSSVRIEASPAATDSEVHVQTGDFSSGEVATVSDDLPSKPDLRFYPDAMVLTENPAASAPALRKGGRRSIEVRLLGGYRS